MSRFPLVQPRRGLPFALTAGLAAVLVGCGGSSSSDFSAAETTIKGTTTAGATVTIGTETGNVALTADASTGAYSRTIGTSSLNTTTQVTVTVSKTGYKTCTTTLTGLSSAGGEVTVTGCTSLDLLGTGEYAPAEGVPLTRLGDGVARAGEANTKLTLATVTGTTKTIDLGSPTGLTLTNYANFNVSVNIRGLEASFCADKVTVFQATSATGTPVWSKVFQAGTANTLSDSPTNGDFATYTFPVAVSTGITTSGGNLFVKLDSGACSTSSDPADDFEFINVTAKFQ